MRGNPGATSRILRTPKDRFAASGIPHRSEWGGLSANGAIVFTNATLRLDQADLDFWLSEANLNAAPAENKGFFQGAIASIKPYVDAKKVSAFTDPTDLVPGIKSVPSHGHTKGNTTYIVESDGQKLVLAGDLMHAAAVQFKDPSVTIAFDTDTKAAIAERKKAYADAVKGRYLIAFTHVSFPGVGHLKAEGKGYEWFPLNYTSSK